MIGFLGTGHPNANGNQALLDLLAVLTWIKENIASFDGDRNRVTLFGHGHGAALVNFLLFVETVKRGKPSMRGDIKKKTGVIKLILCKIDLSIFSYTAMYTPKRNQEIDFSKIIIFSNR